MVKGSKPRKHRAKERPLAERKDVPLRACTEKMKAEVIRLQKLGKAVWVGPGDVEEDKECEKLVPEGSQVQYVRLSVQGGCFNRQIAIDKTAGTVTDTIPFEETPAPPAMKVHRAWELIKEIPNLCVSLATHDGQEQKAILESAAADMPYHANFDIFRSNGDCFLIKSKTNPADVRGIVFQRVKVITRYM